MQCCKNERYARLRRACERNEGIRTQPDLCVPLRRPRLVLCGFKLTSEITAEQMRRFPQGHAEKINRRINLNCGSLLDYTERQRIIHLPLWADSSVGRAADS